jgi:hypothetical protein
MPQSDPFDVVWKLAADDRLKHQPPVQALRQQILDLYLAISQLPGDVVLQFEQIPESILIEKSRLAGKRLQRGVFTFDLPRNRNRKSDLMLAIGSQIRALDDVLSEQQYFGKTLKPMQDWLVQSESNQGFVIPRATRRLPSSHASKRSDLGKFVHRALTHHRVLPRAIGGYAIQLHTAETSFSRDLNTLSFGAAFFSDLQFKIQLVRNTFRVSSVATPKYNELVREHLIAAHSEQCSVLVFPELTINPTCRANICELLRLRPWRGTISDSEWTVPIVVAGSWHESRGRSFVNAATIYDGYGEKLLEHHKIFPYLDSEDGSVEKIQAGKFLSILVLEDALVAFGICRDFSERSIPNPFSELDVDLFLVTSLANRTTMSGHIDTANDVRFRFRAGSFVVQQLYPPNDQSELGFVLSPYDCLDSTPNDLRGLSTWVRKSPKSTKS